MKSQKFKQKRKAWYRCLKQILKIRYKKSQFIYLGDKPTERSIILSNHVGTDGPLGLEIYADFPIRMWGAHEMNSGLKKLYKYQTEVYYHEKKDGICTGRASFVYLQVRLRICSIKA